MTEQEQANEHFQAQIDELRRLTNTALSQAGIALDQANISNERFAAQTGSVLLDRINELEARLNELQSEVDDLKGGA